jgi:hypothetical protein
VSATGSNDQRGGCGRARQGSGRIRQRSGRSGGWVDEATNASHMQTTLISPTPTGILLRTSGNASGLCVRMSCSYETAAVVAVEEATRVTRAISGATQIEPRAVYLQRIRTLTIPPTRQMCRQTSRSCPKSLSEDLRTVGVSAVAFTIPDSERPMVHVRYKQSSRVHDDRAPNSIIPKTLPLATLASTRLTNTPIQRVLAQIGA